MPGQNRRRLGSQYEEAAAEYLESIGYRILEKNFRCRIGEIDLIAKDGNTYVFCEVKYRSDTSKGLPEESVTYRKQRTISLCALRYFQMHCGGKELPCRFDVIAFEGKEMRHYINAFRSRGSIT